MSRTLFVVGNDGSGKSTFSNRMLHIARVRGLSIERRHYYDSVVRSAFRGLVERVARPNERKRETTTAVAAGTAASGGGGGASGRSGSRRALRRLAILLFLWPYQVAMALEARLRDWFAGCDFLMVDRSFVDDLVSISLAMRVEMPPSLLRFSAVIFPIRRIYYLSAGHEVEFARIVDVDLSAEHHRAKGECYEAMIEALEGRTSKIFRFATDRRSRVLPRG